MTSLEKAINKLYEIYTGNCDQNHFHDVIWNGTFENYLINEFPEHKFILVSGQWVQL